MDKREAFWVGLALGQTAGEEWRAVGARPLDEGSRERLYGKSIRGASLGRSRGFEPLTFGP